MSDAPKAGRGARLRILLAPSLLLAGGVLALALHERPRLPEYENLAFRLLFARNEIAGAAVLLVLTAAAPLLARALPLRAAALPALLYRRRFPVAAAAFLVLAAGALLVYHAHPLSMDEWSAVFQAEVFAAGEVTGRFPPDLVPHLIPPFFARTFLTASPTTGRVISGYWPGFSLLLAPFAGAGLPWLLNPLLGAATLLLLARVAWRWTRNATIAGWAVLLAVASAAWAVNAISFYPLAAHVVLGLVWMDLMVVPAAAAGGSAPALHLARAPARLLAAGLVGSLALNLNNPVPHILFAAPWAWALLRREGNRPFFTLAAAYLPSLVPGVAWLWLRRTLLADWPGAAAAPTLLGFTRGAFTLPDGELLYARLLASAELATWAAPFLPLLALAGWRVAPPRSPFRLLAASAATTFLGYFLVPYDQGHGWGYRYFHSAFAALPLLGAVAVVAVGGARWARPVLAAALLAVPVGTGLRFFQVEGFISRHLAQLPAIPDDGVRRVCLLSPRGGSYRVDLFHNDPFLRDPTVWVMRPRDSGHAEDDAAFMARRFPGAWLEASSPEATVWRFPKRSGGAAGTAATTRPAGCGAATAPRSPRAAATLASRPCYDPGHHDHGVSATGVGARRATATPAGAAGARARLRGRRRLVRRGARARGPGPRGDGRRRPATGRGRPTGRPL